MDRYTTSKQIGDGTYGCVMKAVHKQTQEVVAIKRMKQKFFKWEDCINLREVQVLRKLNNHPNIVRLREVIREQNQLFFVFEYMDSDLLAVMKDHAMSGQTGLPQAKIRNIMYQTLQAVAWMHRLGYMHRDLKPENLLLTRELVCNFPFPTRFFSFLRGGGGGGGGFDNPRMCQVPASQRRFCTINFTFISRKGACVGPLKCFQFCELKVYEPNFFCNNLRRDIVNVLCMISSFLVWKIYEVLTPFHWLTSYSGLL